MNERQASASEPKQGLLALQAILERKRVRDLLFVGKKQDAEKMLAGMSRRPSLYLAADLKTVRAAAALERRWSAGVVHHALSGMDWRTAQVLLSRLRDVNCRAVYLCWRRHDEQGSLAGIREKIRALGYTPLGRWGDDVLACFDLDDYKQVPTWLNARDWARPELWNKFRW